MVMFLPCYTYCADNLLNVYVISAGGNLDGTAQPQLNEESLKQTIKQMGNLFGGLKDSDLDLTDSDDEDIESIPDSRHQLPTDKTVLTEANNFAAGTIHHGMYVVIHGLLNITTLVGVISSPYQCGR